MALPRASRNSARARFQRHWTRPQSSGRDRVSNWDGDTHWIDLPSALSAQLGAAFVDFECEVWTDAFTRNYQAIFVMHKGNTWALQSFVVQRYATTENLNFSTSDGVNASESLLQGALAGYGRWVKVRAVKDPVTGMRLTQDGVETGTYPAGTWDLETDMTAVRIGQGVGSLSRYWIGSIRNVMFRDNGGTVIHHWPIDEGSGTVINDIVGGPTWNGTLQGSASTFWI